MSRWVARPRWALKLIFRIGAHEAWARRILLGALTIGLLAIPIMGELQATLRGMHPAGASSYDAGAPAEIGLHLPSRERARDVLNTWERARREAAGLDVSSPKEIFRAFFVVDFLLLAPMYSIALALGLLMLRRRLRTHDLERQQSRPDEEAEAKRRSGTRRLIAGALAAVPALFVLDELENISALLLSRDMGRLVESHELSAWVIDAYWLASWLKWALAAVIVASALIGVFSILSSSSRASRKAFWDSLVAVHVHLLLLVFLAVIVLMTEQGVDVLRSWNGAWSEATAGIGFVVFYALVSTATADRLLRTGRKAGRRYSPIYLIGGGLALVLVGLVFDLVFERAEGVWALGVLIAGIGLLSLPIVDVPPRKERDPVFGRDLLPAILGAAAIAVLGFAVVQASVNDVFYAGRIGGALVLLLLGVGLVASTWLFYYAIRLGTRTASDPGRPEGDEEEGHAVFGPVLWLGGAAVAGLTASVWLAPWETGFALGTIAVVAGWMAAVVLGWTALVLGLDRFATPPVLTLVGFVRIPILSLLLIWALIGGISDDGGYHNVRLRDAAERDPLTLIQTYDRWLADHELERPSPGDPVVPTSGGAEKVGTPLIFVAAPGGGARAAYWTAIALDCLLEGAGCGTRVPEDLESPALFVASGISGGSLGLVTYAARLVDESRPLTPNPSESDWVRARFSSDQLAPTAAWALFADLPNALVRADLLRDRAAVLEESWERAWPDWDRDTPSGLSLGLFQLREMRDSEGRRTPLLLLNGASVEDGCRFNTSFLDGAVEAREANRLVEECLPLRPFESARASVPASARKDWVLASTKDLNEFLCNEEGESKQDIRLSTAALLSARFPYVAPAGRVVKCDEPEGQSATYVVDGGYFDTSAASPIVEVWQALEPWVIDYNLRSPDSCLVPFLIQLDNGYSEPRGPHPNARPLEALVPLKAAAAARNAREANARQAAALSFAQRLFTDDDRDSAVDLGFGLRFNHESGQELVRFAHVYPRAHPGTRAPLGWALSDSAMTDLEEQIGGARNALEVERVHSWLREGALTCEVFER